MYDSYVLEHQPNLMSGFIICVAIVNGVYKPNCRDLEYLSGEYAIFNIWHFVLVFFKHE